MHTARKCTPYMRYESSDNQILCDSHILFLRTKPNTTFNQKCYKLHALSLTHALIHTRIRMIMLIHCIHTVERTKPLKQSSRLKRGNTSVDAVLFIVCI